ncbi:MAG: FeoC-like transcriptional regulator [Enterovibrio sp.]
MMILQELKNFIKANPNCTQAQLAEQFSLSQDGIAAMLSVWQQRGVLNVVENGKERRYRWIEQNEIGIVSLS